MDRPFFAVPAGEGALRSFLKAARHGGVDVYRAIDRMTGAKPLFVTSGIPGSVGSAARALWQELTPRMAEPRPFRVWAVRRRLGRAAARECGRDRRDLSRATYAPALLDDAFAFRRPLVVAKTDTHVRRAALEVLGAAAWRHALPGVRRESEGGPRG